MSAISNLCKLAESDGLTILIFPLLIFIKKITNTTYGGPSFLDVLRYLDISQSKKVNLGAIWKVHFTALLQYPKTLTGASAICKTAFILARLIYFFANYLSQS